MTNELTNKEQVLLNYIANTESNFDFCKLDFSKEWDDQVLESVFQTIVDLEEIATATGLKKNTIKGLLGSLSKKNFIGTMDDTDGYGKPMSWVIINEDYFNNIKAIRD